MRMGMTRESKNLSQAYNAAISFLKTFHFIKPFTNNAPESSSNRWKSHSEVVRTNSAISIFAMRNKLMKVGYSVGHLYQRSCFAHVLVSDEFKNNTCLNTQWRYHNHLMGKDVKSVHGMPNLTIVFLIKLENRLCSRNMKKKLFSDDSQSVLTFMKFLFSTSPPISYFVSYCIAPPAFAASSLFAFRVRDTAWHTYCMFVGLGFRFRF